TGPGWIIDDIQYSQPGLHNIENALAATAMAVEAGLETSAIREGLATYEGVKRRFEYVVNANGVVYIDDYAHHPTEISACIKAARDFYPGKKITGVFQPHLFSRTRDLMDGFAESLSALDEVILLPIYPARELPIDGVDSEALLERIPVNQKSVCEKENLTARILNADCEVLLTLGAGDIDTLVDPLKKGLETKYGLITGREKV
ncbi:MAG: UDP-N-acetylmuramate--L-alanine ligase, partial [Flavobacteriales bacterium]|nr:UDP-N-acetylmuramate--L-alanine ligase [Flavobacteriales bacterium]